MNKKTTPPLFPTLTGCREPFAMPRYSHTLVLIALLLFPSIGACTEELPSSTNCESDRCDEGEERLIVSLPDQERTLDILFLDNEAIVTTTEFQDNREVILTYRVPKSDDILRCPCVVYESSIFRLEHHYAERRVDIGKVRLGLLASVVLDPDMPDQSQISVNTLSPQVDDYLSLYAALRASNLPATEIESAFELLNTIAEIDLESYLLTLSATERLRLFWDNSADLQVISDLFNDHVYFPMTGVVDDDDRF